MEKHFCDFCSDEVEKKDIHIILASMRVGYGTSTGIGASSIEICAKCAERIKQKITALLMPPSKILEPVVSP